MSDGAAVLVVGAAVLELVVIGGAVSVGRNVAASVGAGVSKFASPASPASPWAFAGATQLLFHLVAQSSQPPFK